MRYSLVLAAAVLSWLVAAPAAASTEVNGKVVDKNGQPVADASVRLVNKKSSNLDYTVTSDKKGMFFIPNVFFQEAAKAWTISCSAPNLVATHVKYVGRTAQKVIYDQGEKDVSPGGEIVIRIEALAEVKVDFTLGPPPPVEAVAVPGVEGTAEAESDPFVLAQRKVGLQDFEGAAELLKTSIEAKADDAERRELYAKVLYKLDRSGEALIQANKAAEIAPDHVGPQLLLADLHAARGNKEKAAAALTRARELDPTNTKVLDRIGNVALDQGKLDAAIEAFEALVAADPSHAEGWMSLGNAYNQKGQSDKAEAAFRKVVELSPQNAHEVFFNLGALIENRPELTDADNRKSIEAFRKAAEIKPDYAKAHRHLGFALLRTGDLAGARKSLQEYLDLAPNAPDAAEIRATVKELAPAKTSKK